LDQQLFYTLIQEVLFQLALAIMRMILDIDTGTALLLVVALQRAQLTVEVLAAEALDLKNI
jgi:hypothetical protein